MLKVHLVSWNMNIDMSGCFDEKLTAISILFYCIFSSSYSVRQDSTQALTAAYDVSHRASAA
jgi:hypothetical protein